VVPLQELVEDDAVEEAAEADAEQEGPGVEAARLTLARIRGAGSAARGVG
jgi:hypothetical protein